MASTQNQPLKALPNVLHDQTVPNTLGRMGPPRAAPRRRAPVRVLAASAGVVLAVVVAILARAA
jgi:hypothetical protein